MGVSTRHVLDAQAGRLRGAGTAELHARFAASLVVTQLIGEGSMAGVAQEWGCVLADHGAVSCGQLQKLQTDVGKWTAMAALLCESAGWWPLATAYSSLSKEATAGAAAVFPSPSANARLRRALLFAGVG